MRHGRIISLSCAMLMAGMLSVAVAQEQPAAGEKYQLAYKFKKDQVVRYEVSNQTEMTTHFNDVTETARNRSEAKRHYKVIAVEPDGTASLQLTIDWVYMVASFGDGSKNESKPVEFQSDDPAKHPEKFAHILKTIGKPQATIKFSPLGQPVAVEDKEGGPVTANKPAVINENEKEKTKNTLISDASQENYLLVLPSQPVAVGETWKERFDVVARNEQGLATKIVMQRAYKLAEVKDRKATIEFRTAILTPVAAPAIAAQLIQRETAGKIVFDIEQGLVVTRDVNVDRTVLEPFGQKSSLRASSVYRERLSTEPVASKKD